ncbi:MAG: PIN domain-containing protein [Betaproteobacteria bacterium]|nr:PIN domain-containing protein [Betaproteobacteria bacterium]
MKLFLDASTLLAACGSTKGASRAIFHLAEQAGWTLVSSPYVVSEVERNLSKLADPATVAWDRLRQQLTIVGDVVSLNRPAIFAASKDRPILFTALASAETLLTLDREDFADLIGGQFYGLQVRLPSEFLEQERAAGRLRVAP